MNPIQFKFSNLDNQEFVKVLHSRVNDYFTINKISRKGDLSMLTKTLVTFGIYSFTYFVILFSGVQNALVLFLLWAFLGVCQAFVGICIMHDKVHKSYVKNKLINLLLEIPVILIGVESAIWKIEHNYIHHNYTNIEGLDQDIHPRFIFRFSKHQPRKWFHRFQHIYATFFYGFLIIEWITIKDFMKVVKYRKLGFIKSNLEAWALGLKILAKKSIFYLVFLIIPIHLLPFSGLTVFCMFITMIGIAGVIMTIIFQTAHVVPKTEFIDKEEEGKQENWHIHQLKTTTNYACDNKFLTYLFGGLNFQIEHHLFPDICHVHYPKICQIVNATTKEYDLPYHSYSTFREAVSNHYSLLKSLGKSS